MGYHIYILYLMNPLSFSQWDSVQNPWLSIADPRSRSHFNATEICSGGFSCPSDCCLVFVLLFTSCKTAIITPTIKRQGLKISILLFTFETDLNCLQKWVFFKYARARSDLLLNILIPNLKRNYVFVWLFLCSSACTKQIVFFNQNFI